MRKIALLLVAIMLFMVPLHGLATDNKEEDTKKIADYVKNISKENTYPNPNQVLPKLQPSDLAQELLDTAEVKIENPELIRMLNETNINGSKLALLFNASIYLGQWPLAYESSETNVNWEYKKINTNFVDNRGGNSNHKVHYVQEQQKGVQGGLTANIPSSEEVKKMMMIKAADKTGLPLAFETVIGHGTKKEDHYYNVTPKNLGYLYAYVPAANEKGKVTYGEVYLKLRGDKKTLEVKNVTQQGIGAWIPVQDHISLKFNTSKHPQ